MARHQTGQPIHEKTHSVPYLLDRGHRVVNVDLKPLDHPGVDNLTADITQSGEMFNVMTSYANFDELEPGKGVPSFDAVVHFAAVPRILIHPDNETFRVNTIGTYNVIEAAVKLGIRKIVITSGKMRPARDPARIRYCIPILCSFPQYDCQ